MKRLKFKLFALIALSGLTVMTACNDDDDPEPVGPSITFTSAGDVTGTTYDVDAGVAFTVAWQAQKGDANMDAVTIIVDGTEATDKGYPIDLDGSERDLFQATDTFMFSTAGNHKILFRARDAENLVETKEIDVTVNPAGGPITTRQTLEFGAQNNTTIGSFYNAIDDIVYFVSGAKANSAKVDLIYYNGASNGVTISSPDDSGPNSVEDFSSYDVVNWSTRNETRFNETNMSAAEFAAITTDTPILNAVSGATARLVTNLGQNDVIAFQTDASHGGKAGLIRVVNIEQNSGKSGKITIDIKIQQ